MGDFTKGGGQSLDCICMSHFGSDGVHGTGGSLVIGFVACNLLPVYLSKFVIRGGYNSLI